MGIAPANVDGQTKRTKQACKHIEKCYTWAVGECTCVVTVFCVTWPIKVNGYRRGL